MCIPVTPHQDEIARRIDVQHGADVAIVRLLGKHDMASMPELEQHLRETRSAENVVVDLTETEFIDSSTIRALLRAHGDRAQRNQGFSLLLATRYAVRRVLELSGALDRLPHAPTRDEAVELARARRLTT
jgi:anti-anti-sigma factor